MKLILWRQHIRISGYHNITLSQHQAILRIIIRIFRGTGSCTAVLEPTGNKLHHSPENSNSAGLETRRASCRWVLEFYSKNASFGQKCNRNRLQRGDFCNIFTVSDSTTSTRCAPGFQRFSFWSHKHLVTKRVIFALERVGVRWEEPCKSYDSICEMRNNKRLGKINFKHSSSHVPLYIAPTWLIAQFF